MDTWTRERWAANPVSPLCNSSPGPACVPTKEGPESQMSLESSALSPGPGTLLLPPIPVPRDSHDPAVVQSCGRTAEGGGELAAKNRRAFCLSMHRLPFVSGGKCFLLRFPFYYLTFSREQLPDGGNYLLPLFQRLSARVPSWGN